MRKKFIISLVSLSLIMNMVPTLSYATTTNSNSGSMQQTEQFVTNLYNTLQGRGPDSQGLNYWTKLLQNKGITSGDVVLNFINSPEFVGSNYSNEQFIQKMYNAIHGRGADDGGLKYWKEKLEIGHSRQFVVYNFINSQEFKNASNNIKCNPGQFDIIYEEQYKPVFKIVERAYENIYGRGGDKDGIRYWANLLIEKRMPVSEVIYNFYNNGESKFKNASNTQFIKGMYKVINSSDISNDIFNKYNDKLNAGYSRKLVINDMINSNFLNELVRNTGVIKGSYNLGLSDMRPDIKAFVERAYITLQNRSGDASGVTYWTDLLVNEKITPAELLDNFIKSQEFKNNRIDSTEYLKRLYSALLNRQADQEGLSYWSGFVMTGHSKRFLMAEFVKSPEFTNLCKNVGFKSPGVIYLNSEDFPQYKAITAITKNYDLAIRNTPNDNDKTSIDIPVGSKIIIDDRTGGVDRLGYYKIKYMDKNGKVHEGYIRSSVGSVNTVNIINDTPGYKYLGILSEDYESNGKPGLIADNPGDYGGKSYGAWQLSSNMGSLQSFVTWLYNQNNNFYNRLTDAMKKDIQINSSKKFGVNFDQTWTSIANENYDEFYTLQHNFTRIKYYNPLVQNLISSGDYDSRLNNFAIRNVLWSTSVQHGVTGSTNIIKKFGNVYDQKDFINKIYSERGRRNENNDLVYFTNCSKSIQESVARRFISECKDALKMYDCNN